MFLNELLGFFYTCNLFNSEGFWVLRVSLDFTIGIGLVLGEEWPHRNPAMSMYM